MNKTSMLVFSSCVVALLLVGATAKSDAAVVGVDPSASWVGYMNVFDLPSPGPYPPNLGAYQFGSSWGVADLMATWSGSTLTLAANSINDPNAYWYTPSGGPGAVGNKIMDANLYVEETGTLHGQSVTFSGVVVFDTLTAANNPGNVDANGNGWTSVAFIKDFAPDYSSFNLITIPVSPGPFSVTLDTVNDPTRHVQYGFETMGPDVWITDNATYGAVQIATVPEVSTLAMAGIGASALLILRRRRRKALES